MPQAGARRLSAPTLPTELVTMASFGGAILFVVAAGAGLSSLLPMHASMWLNAGAYGAPAAIAFAAYWWVAQKL
jgi:hypothetical protein